ncbi:DUF1003 domain-containing protein [Hankyongella ginsenosidimutans]|uniref:DUF1003 domain-containing protein n=1 Tax=Hankyongella ginsenosidimutans TaxID=1763828 RepID=A0A4D7CCA4_9SPHN|nr:DUF1003 domain-containing protein [Hankyongella ginsenosidimutans]QCI80142.1 DUF1003 domain-containing protein [Hankyongella ginsenosidimutans]TXG82680.1 MAG: DUF1003 domain-containing protein [Sphingomonadales bacterium]
MQTPLDEIQARRRRLAEKHAHAIRASLRLGERAADIVAATVGSWRFVLIQSALLLGWLAYNSLGGRPFDPFPFILLNLMLSFQAAYTAPIIMMSQNRAGELDRRRSIADFEINQKAEEEIELLHAKIDALKEQELASLAAAVDRLSRLLEQERKA